MVKIAVVGTGYVGLVSGSCLAEIGHKVICVDIDQDKIKKLNSGEIPIYENGLSEIVERNFNKRLFFSTDVDKAIQDSEVIFSAVGTPPGENHKADLRFVKQVAKSFAENLNEYKLFVNKSTVPVGTSKMVKSLIKEVTQNEFDVVSNPEFLREGNAVEDFLKPDRIIVGTESLKASDIMKKIYEPFHRNNCPIYHTNIESAELIKYASNSFLATKISFINEVSKYCDLVGADVTEVAKGMGYDSRIGSKFLNAGIGYGGSCFPKDVDALIESGKENNFDFEILENVRKVNNNQRLFFVNKILKVMKNYEGKTVTVWGLSFKPNTDDVRESPANEIIQKLVDNGFKVNAYDSIAKDNFRHDNPKLDVNYFDNMYDALDNSSALILLTEWDKFKVLDFETMRGKMKNNLIFDGRNIYDPKQISEEGFKYHGVGR